MRRLAVALLAGVAVLIPTSVVGAQSSPSFSSPIRVVAGAPMFVRSVTPCAPGNGIATVTILSQLDQSPGESTSGDLAPDGSWVLTVSAPTDMAAGVTKSYYVTAECSAGGVSYGTRRLYVTGFGGGGGDDAGSESESVEAASAPSATPPLSVPTSKSIRAVEAAAVADVAVKTPAEPTTTWRSDEKERAAEARAELARQTATEDDDVTLSASPVVARAPRPDPDGGIPWWSFVLATMLAVGAVVGYGQRRRSEV